MEEYRAWTRRIRAPEELKDRVLAAAERQTRPKTRRAGTWAACAACLLALVLGGTWGRGEAGTQGEMARENPFVLTAAAAEPGANGGLAFPDGPAELADAAVELAVGEEMRTYRLTEEGLRAFTNEDGSRGLVPALAGDEADVTGLYAVPEDSRWLTWPVAGSNTVSLSNVYGQRSTPNGAVFHAGIDIPGEAGLDIAAAADGAVAETGFDAERGNYLILDHGDGLTTLYGQCRELLANEGDTVKGGETVAVLGSTGMSTGPHLHFEVRQDGEAQNPVAYFDKSVRDTLQMR